MTWSDGMNILGSNEMMCALFDAIRDCAERCQLELRKGPEVVANTAPAPAKPSTRLDFKKPKAPPEANAAKSALLAAA
jgi:hypothetical protein